MLFFKDLNACLEIFGGVVYLQHLIDITYIHNQISYSFLFKQSVPVLTQLFGGEVDFCLNVGFACQTLLVPAIAQSTLRHS